MASGPKVTLNQLSQLAALRPHLPSGSSPAPSPPAAPAPDTANVAVPALPDTFSLNTTEEILRYEGFQAHSFGQGDSFVPSVVELAIRFANNLRDLERPPHAHKSLSDDLSELLEDVRRVLVMAAPGIEFAQDMPGIYHFRVEEAKFPWLPPHYGFKGGVARKALSLALRWNVHRAVVRDLDLFTIGGTLKPWEEEALQKRYMFDDWQHEPGKRIDRSVSRPKYFDTRDLTVNEVFLMEGRVVATAQCLMDTIAGVIRPTRGHLARYQGGASGIVRCKAVRFLVEGELERPMRMAPLPASASAPVTPFHVALHLSRALSRGPSVGQRFVEECLQQRLIKFPHDGTLPGIVESLRRQVNRKKTAFPLEMPPSP